MPYPTFVPQSRSADYSFMPTATGIGPAEAKEHSFILARRLIDWKDEKEQESRKKKLAKLTFGR